jgi:hypothetical protein
MNPPQNDIPFDDWRDDLASTFALQSRLEASKETFPAEFQKTFERKYPNPVTRDYRRNRVEAALRWFENNLTELEETWPDDIVSGDGVGMLSNRIELALYGLYNRCPDEHLHDDFPISVIAQYLE